MKRFALLLLVLLAACQGNSVSSTETIPTAEFKKVAPCALSGFTEVTMDSHGVGSREFWDVYITFHTTCASDVTVKVYVIYPGEPLEQGGFLDGRQKPIGVADAPALPVDPDNPWFGTPHLATVQMPKERVAYPEHWNARFWVEVRSGGTLIGAFRTVDDGTPD